LVARILIAVLFLSVLPAWGGQARQLCLLCHPVHYAERGGCSDCHLGNPAAVRKNIAHAGLRAGKYARFILGNVTLNKADEQLLEQLACRRCHVSGGRGNRLAVNLDAVVAVRPADELARSIKHPVANMPDFVLSDEQVTTLVNALLAGAQGRHSMAGAPEKVHFSTSGTKKPDIFSTKCGSCHRLLSQRLAALGTDGIGPNLSGLLSPYYPKTFRNGEAWNSKNLALWLKNPRAIRSGGRMQPVILTGAELKELEALLIVMPEMP
jgi:cytochrome c2